jgi:hypothetical protein
MSGARHRRRIFIGRGINSIRPRASGGGGPPEHARSARRAVEGRGRRGGPQSFRHTPNSCAGTFCNDNDTLSPAPPPPRFARCASSSGPPPPLSRGRKEKRSRSRDAFFASEFSARTPRLLLPPNKRREAERRKAQFTGAASFGCGARLALGALAFRRSTAVLTEVSRPRLFDFRPGFLGAARGGVTRLAPVPVQRMHPAHRP